MSELYCPVSEELEVIHQGLQALPKTLPCRYFYDDLGSKLFEQICETPEYYITRTELSLLKTIRHELSQLVGTNAHIIEPGSGAGHKIALLLEALEHPKLYIPIDISRNILIRSTEEIAKQFPNIQTHPLTQDFTQLIRLPDTESLPKGKRVTFFPGSTIGNFLPDDAINFMKKIKTSMESGSLIIGVDLIKDRQTLEDAYNDKQGITAKFNKNILRHMNDMFGANFQLHQFKHTSIYNESAQRIEMYLMSQKNQHVQIGNNTYAFDANERILTEYSHKYTVQSFQALATKAGFQCIKHWIDRQHLFSIHYLECSP